MPFRFRKKVKIAPGIRLNISKGGLSTSFGKRGATLNVGRRGVRETVGIPGSGISYTTGGKQKRRSKKGCSLLTISILILSVLFGTIAAGVLFVPVFLFVRR
jgi:hypothetical protein